MVDNDTFALPFWNWDNPPGMFLPVIFKDSSSPLYDSLRNPSHLNTVLDLSYEGTDSKDSTTTVIRNNLYLMYKQMVTQSTTPLSFFKKAFRAGETSDPGAGSIETSPHTNVHVWTGDPNESHGEDMGSFDSAGRDPTFYCHHANAKPVKVYVKDCLDTSVLGYTYQTVDIPWLNSKPSPRRTAIALPTAPTPSQVFPTTLEKAITVLVKRPKKKSTKTEKQKAEEVLEISGIQYNIGEFVKFDVYINEDTPDESGPEKTELLGSFTNVPHGHSMISTTTKSYAISEVLQELGADEFESVLVTLVPKSSTITISGVKIKYDNTKVSA
ncbi:polyphenol oxidase, chloroplastic-like [Coffea arabica]|uniref:Polyphenol oxidase, chloroplastic-like n=1 Tax=Coffea arabica TaxID=13443 RepID=A0A6P6W1R7_COFAR|nr:polyphenol oxidase, chloroplastic-like [Coffea arabica]